MSLFPFIENTTGAIISSITTIPKEYAWDFENNEFKLRNGKIYIVEGLEALKIWIYKALKTQRYRYMAYSWDYGIDLEELIGKGFSREYTESEIKRMIEDALLINPYIDRIKNIIVTFFNDTIIIDLEVETKIGQVNLSGI